MQKLEAYQLSIHCWQGDDLRGFEQASSELTGSGLQVTGNYPGRPRNVEELRQDLEKALSLIPGRHRLNLLILFTGNLMALLKGMNMNQAIFGVGWIGLKSTI